MRKIILNLCTSLDGFIEGPSGEYDWCFTDQDYGMTDFLSGIDTIFFGRKSYELFIKDAGTYFSDKEFVVFSKSFLSDDVKIISENIYNEVLKIVESDGKDIWLFGGASLFNTLFELKLVDELIISVHPILLGSGKLLFSDTGYRTGLKLIESKAYDSGLVQVRYSVKK